MRYTDAILGAETQVATIHGQAALRIPAGTQNGQVLTMRGAGISPGAAGLASSDGVRQIGAGESQRGAHHFTVIVVLPGQVLPWLCCSLQRQGTLCCTRQLEIESSSGL